MQNQDLFDVYALYYDLLYKEKDYRSEVDYVHNLISKYCPGAKSLIDFGCGTGRHDILFAQKGYDVIGVDLSEKMISLAKINTTDKLNFLQGDVRNIRLNKEFDIAVSLFHVMSYQNANLDIENFFETAKIHVKDGGLFIFDCWYGPAVLLDRPVVRVKRLENELIKLVRISEPEIHPNENYVEVHFDIDVTEKKTGKHSSTKELHMMRYLFYPEMELFTIKSGFKIVCFEEWLTGKLPGFSSWYVVFVCKKGG
jgi:SAM-dependent methyltransferase